MKKRTARWEKREHLKRTSNRYGREKAEHPQVRRQIDRTADQLESKVEEPTRDEQ